MKKIFQKILKKDLGINIIQKIDAELTQRELNINSDNISKITTLIKNEISNCFQIEVHSNEEEKKEENEQEKEEEKEQEQEKILLQLMN